MRSGNRDNYAFDAVVRLIGAVSGAVLLSGGAFTEGTHGKGWDSVSAYDADAWAERSHEPRMMRLSGLLHVAILTLLVSAEFDSAYNAAGIGAVKCAASFVVWTVLLARIAAATHATSVNHSVITVPWHALASATTLITLPPALKLAKPYLLAYTSP